MSSLFASCPTMKIITASYNFYWVLNFYKARRHFITLCESYFESSYFFIHGCYMASASDIRLLGSYVSNFDIKSFASSETSYNSGILKLNSPIFTFFIISSSFLPSKGGRPASIT